MSDPVNHHYLPIFYLKAWANPAGKVVRYYRPHAAVVASPITPDNTGYEPNLYALEGHPPEQRQVIEREFMSGHVDGPAADALQVLLEYDRAKLTNDLRVAWTRFLISMRLRDPATVSQLGDMARTFLKNKLLEIQSEYEALKSPRSPATAFEWLETNAQSYLLNAGKLRLPNLIQHEGIGEHIFNMRWSMLNLRDSNVTLLTSDRPFVMTTGLKQRNCLIALPVSPQLLFIAYNERFVREQLERYRATELAKAVNTNIVTQAVKHVYGASDSHRLFIERNLRREG